MIPNVHKDSILFDGHLNATKLLGWTIFPGVESESENMRRGGEVAVS